MALLEPFIVQDESSARPGEDRHAVPTATDENERDRRRILAPLVLHDGQETIDAVAHVRGAGGEEDPDRGGEGEHRSPKGGHERGDIAGEAERGATRKAELDGRGLAARLR